jgi:hypothetical protein
VGVSNVKNYIHQGKGKLRGKFDEVVREDSRSLQAERKESGYLARLVGL